MDIKQYIRSVTVEPVLFLYMMAIFLESNGIKSIINTKACLQIYSIDNCSNKTFVSNKDVITIATQWNKYYEMVLFSCTLAVCCYVASWTDFLGRKVIMLIPLIGTIIATIANTLLSVFIDVHISYFIISGTISGLTFGTLGIIASTFAYVSDIVPQETRTIRILLLEVMIYAGSSLGTFICGEILRNTHINMPFNNFAVLFSFEGALIVVTLIYVVFRIPNTMNINDMQSTNQFPPKLFSLSHLKIVVKTVFKARHSGKRTVILLLMLCLVFIYYGSIVQLSLSFYFTELQLNWTMTDFSHYKSLQLGLEGSALAFGLPLAYYLGIMDGVIVVIGVLSRMSGLLLFGLSYDKHAAYASAALAMASEFSVPTIRSMLSKLVDDDERGKIFAFTTIIQNVCFFTGGYMFSTIFLEVKDSFPGLPFEIVAGFQAIVLLIFWYLYFGKSTFSFCRTHLCCREQQVVTVYETFVNEDGTISEQVTAAGDELRYPVA